MKKIRIGKTIDLRWVIFVNGIEQNIEDFDLSLVLIDAYGRQRDIEDYSINNENVLEFTLNGKDFNSLGKYIISLYVNKGKDNQSVLDYRYAFELVKYTDQEEDEIDGDLDINETVELSGNLESFTQGEVLGDYVTHDEMNNILDGYVSSNEISTFLKPEDVSDFLREADLSLDNYVKNSSLSANYAKKSEIQDFVLNSSLTANYVKKNEISTFITMDDVNSQGFLKAPDVSRFLTENDCSIYLTANNVSNFLTEADLTLDEYCKNSSIS
jgi:hypothetical protein